MGVLIWNTAVALFGTAKLILREIPQNTLIWGGGLFGPPNLAGIARLHLTAPQAVVPGMDYPDETLHESQVSMQQFIRTAEYLLSQD